MKAPLGIATRSDQWLVIALSASVIVGMLIETVRRVIEIAPNRDVAVVVQFPAERQPITIDGVGEVPVEFDRATVVVPDLPFTSWAAALAGAVLTALAVIAVMVCVAWLCRNLGATMYFSRTNTRLLMAMSFLIGGGWVVNVVTATLVGNGALAQLSQQDSAPVTLAVSFEYLFAAIVVGCLAAAFHAGERLQRDAEGIV